MVDNTDTQDQANVTDGAQPAPKDILPEPDADQDPPLPDASAAAETPAAADEPPAEPGPEEQQLMPGQAGYNDQKRHEITRLYREQRDAEKAGAGEGEGGEEPPAGSEEIVAQEDVTPAAEEPAPAPAPADEEEKVTLVVYGQEIEVPRSEVIRQAQISTAADQRLDESKELLDKVKQVLTSVPAQVDQPGQGVAGQEPHPEPAEAPEAQTSDLDREKLSDIAQRLQVGDEEDAESALEELVNMTRGNSGPSFDPAEIDRIVAHRVASSEKDIQFKAALSKFGDDYPKIMANEDLGHTAINVAARHMRSEMREKAGLSDESIAQLGNDSNAISTAYRELLMHGHPLKPYDALFDGVGQEMTETFKLGDEPTPQPQPDPNPGQGTQPTTPSPDNTQQVQKRTVRKRAAQQQPTAAGGRQPQAPAKPRGKTSKEIVDEMRRQRGYPVHQ